MLHYFWGAVVAQTLAWFPLQALVDEVDHFNIPASWTLRRPQFDFLVEHLLFEILTSPALVRPFVKHELMANHTNSIIIRFITVILFEYDLRCHIAWCTRGLVRVFPLKCFGNSKISDFDASIFIKDQIFRLDIPMNDAFWVYIFQSNYQACNYKSGLILIELDSLADVISQITTIH